MKLAIDRLPGSLWGSGRPDRNAPETAFPLRRPGPPRSKVTHQYPLRRPPMERIRPALPMVDRYQLSKKAPLSKANPRSVSSTCDHRLIDDRSLEDIMLGTGKESRSRPTTKGQPERLCLSEPAPPWRLGAPRRGPERFRSMDCVCVWLHALSQSLPMSFRSSRPIFENSREVKAGWVELTNSGPARRG